MERAAEDLRTSRLAKHKRHSWVRLFVGAVGAVFIFTLGVGVGKGSIIFGPDAAFRKSVQKGLPADLDYSSVEQLYDVLKRDYDGQLDTQKLLDGLKAGLAEASGDTYTEYLTAAQAKEFDDDLNGTFSGIGATLIEKDKFITVEIPLTGYPAEKAGIKAKDVVVEIDGKNAYDIGIKKAVELIRGQEGTKVKLKIIRDNKEQLEFEITRAKITVPSVEGKILDGNIGYIKISRFGSDTPGLARQVAQKFANAKVKGVILDVRNNPGGLLETAVDVSSLWLDSGKTVLDEKRGGVIVSTHKAKGEPIFAGLPTVVLINEGSASASEIIAGALKDNGVATLIGVKSYGKGSVQSVEELADGGVLKVTVARWYRPNGKNIDKEGIEPDQKVERSDNDFKNNQDSQKDAAINFLKK